ncbi:uncharacterized protein LOC62_04G005347 [Vanrija pseudolonga]|uniref:Uncharacterized protein n=1 Tax=Vanrija pseudolonga TaxID=143232 RepID=A0AAF0YBM9_9TREE|nr:hypothetical protein LOC62_04G005347 [Vanrija pseudolonga]
MTTLDHTSYPDILDRIISLSPDDVLPQLRLVSRYCRDAVDARRLSHAVLEANPRRDCPPLFPSRSDDVDRSWPFLLSLAGTRLPYLPHLVHTLDQRAAAHPSKQLSNDFSLHTLRRMRGAYVDPVGYLFPEPHFQPRARTIVDFIEVIRVRFAEGDGPQARQYVDSTLHATESYVLHLRVVHAGARPPAITVRNALGATRFTLVLWHGHDAPLELPHLGVYSALETFLREWDGGEVSITLVGMEVAAPESRPEASWAAGGSTAQALWDGWMAYLADEAYVEIDERPVFLRDAALVEQVRRVFRVVTYAQWWAELGSRREVEGVWPTEASFEEDDDGEFIV